jgi:hypothetical protein
MRISKTSGRATPRVAKAKKPARSQKVKLKQTSAAASQALNHRPAPSQLSGLELALRRLADGISQLEAAPLSGATAQQALQGLRE